MLALLLATAAATGSLDAGAEALAEFRVADALRLLEQARSEGPYSHADHVRLHEQIGVALAYAGRNDEAIEAFDRMLAIAPAHALSYSLSPKATLPFEHARRRARERPTPQVDLALPRGREVGDALPIDLDVLADPFRFLAIAKISYRVDPEPWTTIELRLDDPTRRHRVVIPPIAPRESDAELLLHVAITDTAGNEVLLLGTEREPRIIALDYVAPEPWYGRWWVWTTAGLVIAGGVTTAVVLATQSDDPTIAGRVVLER